MGINKFAATATMVIGATAVGSGTAYSQQAQPVSGAQDSSTRVQDQSAAVAPPVAVEGVDREHGIRYRSRAVGRHGMEVTLVGATFALNPEAGTLSVADRNGTVVATISTTIPIGGHRLELKPVVDQSRQTVRLTPVDLPPELLHASPAAIVGMVVAGTAGMVAGAFAGLLGGLVGGLLVFVVGVIPGLLFGPMFGAFLGGAMGSSAGYDLGTCGSLECPQAPPGRIPPPPPRGR
jgi:hypothetical protein